MSLVRLFLLVVLIGFALPVKADATEPPKHGLMLLLSSLPAVLPLQVKTAPGQDYHLTLVNAETDAPVLLAYIEGGEFFRVLVPPGSYRLRFAYGEEWESHEALFGDATRFYEFEEPLRFEIKGVDRKVGHILDLRGLGEHSRNVKAKQLLICQTVRLEPDDRPLPSPEVPPFDEREEDPFAELDRGPRYEIYARVCD